MSRTMRLYEGKNLFLSYVSIWRRRLASCFHHRANLPLDVPKSGQGFLTLKDAHDNLKLAVPRLCGILTDERVEDFEAMLQVRHQLPLAARRKGCNAHDRFRKLLRDRVRDLWEKGIFELSNKRKQGLRYSRDRLGRLVAARDLVSDRDPARKFAVPTKVSRSSSLTAKMRRGKLQGVRTVVEK